MTRSQLEHIIRAAGTIADDNDLIVIGSQAILGQFPEAPGELLVSNEADMYPRSRPDRSDLIDATIGEGSPFQRSFGYCAHGVDETTAILPEGWRDRLILVAVNRRVSCVAGAWKFRISRLQNMRPGARRTWNSQERATRNGIPAYPLRAPCLDLYGPNSARAAVAADHGRFRRRRRLTLPKLQRAGCDILSGHWRVACGLFLPRLF